MFVPAMFDRTPVFEIVELPVAEDTEIPVPAMLKVFVYPEVLRAQVGHDTTPVLLTTIGVVPENRL
jgi:hypothetical protein